MSLNVQVEEIDSIRRRLVVEIPEEVYTDELQSAERELTRSIRVPGFRPGRVPRNVVQQRYGARLRADVQDKLVRRTLADALDQEKISPLAPPEVVTEPAEAGSGLRYSATVEVKPVVALADWQALPLQRPVEAIEDQAVDEFLERLRESQAQLDPVEGRSTIAVGDVVLADVEATAGDERLTKVEKRHLLVGESGFPDGFDDKLIGGAVGETLAFEIEYPAEFDNPSLAGKAVQFAVEVHGLFDKVVPALDDEFAKDHGDCADLAELKAKVRGHLEAEATRRGDAEVRRSALQALAERHDLEVPQAMMERRLEALIDDVRQEWKQKRLWPPNETEIVERLRADFADQARDQVKVSLVLEAIAQGEALAVSDDELDASIERMGAEAGVPTDQMQAIYGQPEARASLRARLLQSKALDTVVERATIEDVQKQPEVADASETN